MRGGAGHGNSSPVTMEECLDLTPFRCWSSVKIQNLLFEIAWYTSSATSSGCLALATIHSIKASLRRSSSSVKSPVELLSKSSGRFLSELNMFVDTNPGQRQLTPTLEFSVNNS